MEGRIEEEGERCGCGCECGRWWEVGVGWEERERREGVV